MNREKLRIKNTLVLLNNVLILWERERYAAAVMELEELKMRIQRRIKWTEEEIKRLTRQLKEYRSQLGSLKPIENLEEEYTLNELMESEEVDIRAYAGMTQEEAVLDALGVRGKKLVNPKAITALLKERGYNFRTEAPLNSIYVLLNRLVRKGKVVSEKTEDNGVCFRIPEKTKRRLPSGSLRFP